MNDEEQLLEEVLTTISPKRLIEYRSLLKKNCQKDFKFANEEERMLLEFYYAEDHPFEKYKSKPIKKEWAQPSPGYGYISFLLNDPVLKYKLPGIKNYFLRLKVKICLFITTNLDKLLKKNQKHLQNKEKNIILEQKEVKL